VGTLGHHCQVPEKTAHNMQMPAVLPKHTLGPRRKRELRTRIAPQSARMHICQQALQRKMLVQATPGRPVLLPPLATLLPPSLLSQYLNVGCEHDGAANPAHVFNSLSITPLHGTPAPPTSTSPAATQLLRPKTPERKEPAP
jgi:hypothetical protein